MSNKVFLTVEFIVLLLFAGYFVCRFAFDSKFYIFSKEDFLGAGLILQLILMMWKTVKEKERKKNEL